MGKERVKKDREERENLVLWKAPVGTITNFVAELFSILCKQTKIEKQAEIYIILSSKLFAKTSNELPQMPRCSINLCLIRKFFCFLTIIKSILVIFI